VLPAQKLAQTRPAARGALLFHACLPIWRRVGLRTLAGRRSRPNSRHGQGPDLRRRGWH
jgi:hypothetical protein